MPRLERWQTRPSIRWGLLSVVLLGAVCVSLPAAASSTPSRLPASADAGSIFLADGVVVAPERARAFVMGAEGKLEALDLASGAVRWSTPGPAKPLTAVGDRLVAQARPEGRGALELILLDAERGTRLERVSASLPTDVLADVVDGPGTSFRLRSRRAGAELVLGWRATTTGPDRAAQGYLPAATEDETPGAALAARDRIGGFEGALRLDPVSGRTSEIGLAARDAGLSRAPVLRQLDAETGLAGVSPAGARQFASADGRHVLVTRPLDGEPSWRSHEWSIHERATGALVGTVQRPHPALAFVVVDAVLYSVSPASAVVEDGTVREEARALRAVDLASGTELWARSIEEVQFRGPFPP